MKNPLTLLITILCISTATLAQTVEKPFRIFVRDGETKRGVPLVELTATNSVTWITDSAGMIAFDEPGLMNKLDVTTFGAIREGVRRRGLPSSLATRRRTRRAARRPG
jgi:hypothetical protein